MALEATESGPMGNPSYSRVGGFKGNKQKKNRGKQKRK